MLKKIKDKLDMIIQRFSLLKPNKLSVYDCLFLVISLILLILLYVDFTANLTLSLLIKLSICVLDFYNIYSYFYNKNIYSKNSNKPYSDKGYTLILSLCIYVVLDLISKINQ